MKDFKMKYPLNIQLFGDDGDAGNTEGQENSKNTEKPNEPQGFTQADIDRAVTKAVQTATSKNEDAIAIAVSDALAEERRQATLTEEQRKEEARIAAEKAYEAKEAELNEKILRVDVGQVLVQRGLNPSLIDFVLGSDVKQSVERIDKLVDVINKEVERGINKVVVKPGVPSKQDGKISAMTKNEIMGIKDDEERHKQIALHPELFNYGG